MNIRLFGCGKFEWLLVEAEDRSMTDRENVFLNRHRNVCPQCELTERQNSMALNMLRESAIDAEPQPNFDERVLRRHRIGLARASVQYWSPAVFGAAIAMVAVLAAMQMVARSAQLPAFQAPGADARKVEAGAARFPELEIPNKPSRAQ